MVIMDFSKAFDKVSHPKLLQKLEYYGIQGTTSAWIRGFLSNRSQKVIINGTSSDNRPVTSGVPQGTVLGPILFLIYINDIANNLNCSIRLFADDCIIYSVINNISDCTRL